MSAALAHAEILQQILSILCVAVAKKTLFFNTFQVWSHLVDSSGGQ